MNQKTRTYCYSLILIALISCNENGAEIIKSVFESMYPEREILRIIELAC